MEEGIAGYGRRGVMGTGESGDDGMMRSELGHWSSSGGVVEARSFGVVDRDVLGEGGAITMSSSVVIMVGGGSAR